MIYVTIHGWSCLSEVCKIAQKHVTKQYLWWCNVHQLPLEQNLRAPNPMGLNKGIKKKQLCFTIM